MRLDAGHSPPPEREQLRECVNKVKYLEEVISASASDLDDAWSAIERVRAVAVEWSDLAPEDDWGDDMASTVMADIGRVILRLLDEGK